MEKRTVKIRIDELKPLIESIYAEEGILSQKKDVMLKYRLSLLGEKFGEKYNAFEKTRVGLIKTHGTIREGRHQCTPEDSGWEDFIKEITDLMSSVEEFEVPVMKEDDFNFESSVDFSVMIKYFVYGG